MGVFACGLVVSFVWFECSMCSISSRPLFVIEDL